MVGKDSAKFLSHGTTPESPNTDISKATGKRIVSNDSVLQQGKHPNSGADNILTEQLLKILELTYQDILEGKHPTSGSDNVITPDVLKWIESNVAKIQQLRHPSAGSDNIFTEETLKLIDANVSKVMEISHPSAGADNIITEDVLQLIEQNYQYLQWLRQPSAGEDNIITDAVLELIDINTQYLMQNVNPSAGSDNIITDQVLTLIQNNYDKIIQMIHPIEGSNNILSKETLSLIEKNLSLILQLKHPIEGQNNIGTQATLDLIEKNLAEILQLKHPIEGENNIVTDETLALIDKNMNDILEGKHPPEAQDNILVKETLDLIEKLYSEILEGVHPVEGENNVLVKMNKPGFETIDTLKRINQNENIILQGRHPVEGENNVLVDRFNKTGFEQINTLSTIKKNESDILQGKHPVEGENNVLVDGLNKTGFERIDTLSTISRNESDILQGKHPVEGENNILVDGLNKTGFESIDTLRRINTNESDILQGKHPVEGENNVLVDGLNKTGFESINTLTTINKNESEILQGKHPTEGEDNVLVDGQNQKGFEQINTLSTISKNEAKILQGKHPVEGENNILVSGKNQQGFEKIDTIKTINENESDILQGKHPEEGENNILVDGLNKTGFERIDTLKTISENESEIDKGRHPTQGEDNVLVDGHLQQGFERIDTLRRINTNESEILQGKHPTQGEDNVLVDHKNQQGFEQINTISTINENDAEIQQGKHPTQGEDNVLVSGQNRTGFETIDTLKTINENDAEIQRGKQPTQGEDNVLVDQKQQQGFERINTLTTINKNDAEIQRGKQPTQGEDNILVAGQNRAGFETIDTLTTINENDAEIKENIHPDSAHDNIANADAVSLQSGLTIEGFKPNMDYYEKIREMSRGRAQGGNFFNNEVGFKTTDSLYIFDSKTSYHFDLSRLPWDAYVSDPKTLMGDFQKSSLQYEYKSVHHGQYDIDRGRASSTKENFASEIYDANDQNKLLLNRPLSLSEQYDRESDVFMRMKKIGYRFDYDTAINRVGNIETQYRISTEFQKGEATGYDSEGKNTYRNYYAVTDTFPNSYRKVLYNADPLAYAKSLYGEETQYDAISILYPHRDTDGKFFYPTKEISFEKSKNKDDYRIYENTPINLPEDNLYATDPFEEVDGLNKIRNILKIKQNIQNQISSLNKFGEDQHDFYEYTYNYLNVPNNTWLSEDLSPEDFRYFQIYKTINGTNPAQYNFGNVKKYDGEEGHRRQVDYYRNNPTISYGLERMKRMYLGNPRNAQIFDPISMFWHPDEGKTGAIDVRKDLRLLGGAPKSYLHYFRPDGLIEGLANASGGNFGESLNRLAPFIETGFDIVTRGEERYTSRIWGGEGIVWANMGFDTQVDFTANNLFNRSLDIAAQFINPASFTVFSEIDRYLNGFSTSLTNGTPQVYVSAKLGLVLGQIAGSEFRVMRGRDTLTTGQRLAGDGPVTLNDAMELLQSVFGNRVDNLDYIDGPSSYHEYLTDPRVWNIDQRLAWNNLGSRLHNAPEKPNESGSILDPIQIGKNILKTVGINLDNPFASSKDTETYDQFKAVVVTTDRYFAREAYKTLDKKMETIQSTGMDDESQIYQNDITHAQLQERTSHSTRPDWFRDKFDRDKESEYIQHFQILREYGLESNFKPGQDFTEWYTEYNDGNVQYVYDEGAKLGVEEGQSGKLVDFDYFDYVGTVKTATPNIENIVERQRAENQRREEEYEKAKQSEFTLKASIYAPLSSTEKKALENEIMNKLSQHGTSVENVSTISFADPFKGDLLFRVVGNNMTLDDMRVNDVVPSFNKDASLSNKGSYTIINKKEKTDSYNSSGSESGQDIIESEEDIIAKQGIPPTSFDKLNKLVNEVDPQIFRFWIRTISRTHYEVTPEVFYLDDYNKIQLARPRYTGHSLVFFDAIVKNVTEQVNPNWQPTNFFGRTEDVFTWASTSRHLQLTTSFMVSSPSQMPSLRAKIQELERMCYPQIQTLKSVGVLAYRAGPVIEFAIGDQWRAFGYIQAISITWSGSNGEPIWETIQGGQFIRGADVNIDFQIFHKELPHAGTEFFAESFEPDLFYHDQSTRYQSIKTTSDYLQLSEKTDIVHNSVRREVANTEIEDVPFDYGQPKNP